MSTYSHTPRYQVAAAFCPHFIWLGGILQQRWRQDANLVTNLSTRWSVGRSRSHGRFRRKKESKSFALYMYVLQPPSLLKRGPALTMHVYTGNALMHAWPLRCVGGSQWDAGIQSVHINNPYMICYTYSQDCRIAGWCDVMWFWKEKKKRKKK